MSSFKESGGIESLADVLIGLDFKTMLKNRNRVDIEHEKLYKELGFENFEDYTLNNFNFDKRTINRRLQDAESFREEYETALTSFGEKYNGALRSYGQHKTHQLATMPEEQRNITLTILKNKLGETGCSVDFKYYPAYNLFKEVEEFLQQLQKVRL